MITNNLTDECIKKRFTNPFYKSYFRHNTIILITLMIYSLIWNMLMVVGVFKAWQKPKFYQKMIITLSFSDFGIAALVLPLHICLSENLLSCKMALFTEVIGIVLATISLILIVFTAVFRYMAINHRKFHRKLIRLKSYHTTFTFLLIHIIPSSYMHVFYNGSKKILKYYEFYNGIIMLIFILLMVSCNMLLICNLRQSINSLEKGSSSHSLSISNRNVCITLLLMSAVALLMTLTFSITSILEGLSVPITKRYGWLYELNGLLMFGASGVNSKIFVLSNTTVKEFYKETIRAAIFEKRVLFEKIDMSNRSSQPEEI